MPARPTTPNVRSFTCPSIRTPSTACGSNAPPSRQHRAEQLYKWLIGALVLAVAVGAYALLRDNAIEVETATACNRGERRWRRRAVLNASGYVVARRQATVSAKTTGKVAEVLIEEGMAVKEGQLLARLDDTTTTPDLRARAAPAGCRAQESRRSRSARRGSRAQLAPHARNCATTSSSANRSSTRRSPKSAALERAARGAEERSAGRRRHRARARAGSRRSDRARAVRRRRRVEGCAARRDGVADLRGRRLHAHRNRDHRRHGFARNRSRRQRGVHQSREGRIRKPRPCSMPIRTWTIPSHVINIVPTADRQKATVRVRIAFDVLEPRILPDMGVKVSFLDDRAGRGPQAAAPRPAVRVPAAAVIRKATPLRLARAGRAARARRRAHRRRARRTGRRAVGHQCRRHRGRCDRSTGLSEGAAVKNKRR